MSDSFTDEQRQAIDAEIFAGHKIQAVKLVRDAANCDLLTAKNVVEAREAQLRETSAERFAPRKAGCSVSVGVLLLALTIAALLLTS